MANVTPLKAIIRELGDYLKAEMPSIQQVLEDFPDANVELQLPSVSIFSSKPEFRPELAQFLAQPLPAAVNNKAASLVVIGAYDFQLQVDIWCGYKEERFKLYDEFFAAMNKQGLPAGLSLQLESYHNTWARYDIAAHSFDDSEAGSQRDEWRVKVDLLAHCKAIVERDEFIITQPIETNLETPNNIPEP